MSDWSALEGEMAFRDLNPEDDRTLATFALATRAALSVTPDQALTRNVVPELAAAASQGSRAAARSAPASRTRVVVIPRRRPRFAMAGRIAFAVALLPALFAGMAVAGVKLPGPAADAFEAVGVDLPNQDDSAEGANSPGSVSDDEQNPAGKTPPGRSKSNPAREGGRANGEQGRGRALGKRGIAPGKDKANGGNGSQGNKGGNGKAIGKTDAAPPGQLKSKPVVPPRPVIPPGQTSKPPQANAGTPGGSAGPGGNGNGPVDKTLSGLGKALPN